MKTLHNSEISAASKVNNKDGTTSGRPFKKEYRCSGINTSGNIILKKNKRGDGKFEADFLPDNHPVDQDATENRALK